MSEATPPAEARPGIALPLAYVALVGLGRAWAGALALSVAGMLPLSWLNFQLIWAALLLPVTALTAAAELPLLASFGYGAGRGFASADQRAPLISACCGLLWGGAALTLPSLRPLGLALPLLLAVAGGLAWLTPVRQQLGGWRRGLTPLPIATLIALAALWPEPPRAMPAGPGAEASVDEALPRTRHARALAIARRWMERTPPESMPWTAESSLLIEGLLAAGAQRPQLGAEAYAIAWLTAHAERHDDPGPDAFAARLVSVRLTRLAPSRNGDPMLIHLRQAIASRAQVALTPSGSPSYTRGLATDRAEGLLSQIAPLQRTGGPLEARLARAHSRALIGSLWDARLHLLRHQRLYLGRATVRLPVEPTAWARASALALRVMVDDRFNERLYETKPDRVLHDQLRQLTRRLLELQDGAGLWRVDLIGPTQAINPVDTVASGLICAALTRGRALEVFEESQRPAVDRAILKARGGLTSRLRWHQRQLEVIDAAGDVPPSSRAFYLAAPREVDSGWAVAAALAWLTADDVRLARRDLETARRLRAPPPKVRGPGSED